MMDEPEDFEPEFRRLYPRAVAIGRRMLGSMPAAEDVASEAFARALLRWPRLDPAMREGWVVRVTANLCIDELRRRGRGEQGVVDLRDHETVAMPATDRVALAEALRHLPRRQREVVVLRCLGDLSEAEVAERLGITVGSVKTHLSRGLAALRTRLADRSTSIIDLAETPGLL